MIRDPYELYRQPKVKSLLTKLLFIGMAFVLLWNMLELIIVHGVTNFWDYLGGATFMTSIVIIIFMWIGYLILNGKFRPPVDYQKNQNIPPHLRQPTRPPPLPPQQIQTRQPTIDYCSFCNKSFPIKLLRPFVDRDGNIIHVCPKCFENES